jgi:uncharacterized protein (TIGR02421 family)
LFFSQWWERLSVSKGIVQKAKGSGSMQEKERQYFAKLDARLVAAVKGIRILSSLAWPKRIGNEFLEAYKKGSAKLPEVPMQIPDFKSARQELMGVIKDCDHTHPLGRYIAQTAASYVVAARMLEGIKTDVFTRMSEMLYGNPTDRLGSLSNLDLAENFIQITTDFASATDPFGREDEESFSASQVVAILKKEADTFFGPGIVKVELDSQLAAKAAAGSERVRIREQGRFYESEIDQLLEHELFVHSATMLNGRRQPYLKSLGLGAPRTTGTQEGLATFAELITDSMDLTRLRRIALRIKAIQLALDGGDFIDVFKFFGDSGQTLEESYQSTARIFRGGDVRGRHVFTKDVVYLKGLVSVHTFFRKAIEHRKIHYPKMLFTGRMALGDVISLEPFIGSYPQTGSDSDAQATSSHPFFVQAPEFVPNWVAKRESLAAYLCYAAFTHQIDLKSIKLIDFVDSSLDEDLEGLDLGSL